MPTPTSIEASPKAACDIKVDVLSWERVAAANPERGALDLQEKACGKKGAICALLCKGARQGKARAQVNVMSQKISANIVVTPSGAAPLNKLVQSTPHTPMSSSVSQAEIENGTLQAALGPTLVEFLDRGGCK